MIVRKLRLQKGWSQEHLAQLCGLNVRTIQRIERGQQPSLESKKSLAAVFEVDIASFDQLTANKSEPEVASTESSGEAPMTDNLEKQQIETIESDEQAALEYAKGIKEFLTHLAVFILILPVIIYKKMIEEPLDEPVLAWLMLGWAVGLIVHGLVAFEKLNFINVNWEKKIAEKKLGRKL